MPNFVALQLTVAGDPLQCLGLRAAFRVPVAWLRKLAQASAAKLPGSVPDPSTVDVMRDQVQAQGYVVRDGEYVKGEASFAKGALTVNGKPLGPK
jgi:hypothetical protein